MNEQHSNSFRYEHCDVPQGKSLAEWRTARADAARRRPYGPSAMLASLASRALSARGRSGR
jgi:hypothetical protein